LIASARARQLTPLQFAAVASRRVFAQPVYVVAHPRLDARRHSRILTPDPIG
jgi:hypothetical protein